MISLIKFDTWLSLRNVFSYFNWPHCFIVFCIVTSSNDKIITLLDFHYLNQNVECLFNILVQKQWKQTKIKENTGHQSWPFIREKYRQNVFLPIMTSSPRSLKSLTDHCDRTKRDFDLRFFLFVFFSGGQWK